MTKEIGQIKSPKGKTFVVLWDEQTGEVFVRDMGGFFSGGFTRKCPTRAKTARDAMHVAEAFVYNQ